MTVLLLQYTFYVSYMFLNSHAFNPYHFSAFLPKSSTMTTAPKTVPFTPKDLPLWLTMTDFDIGEKTGSSVVICVCIATPRPSFLAGNGCFDFAHACYQTSQPNQSLRLILDHFFLRAGASVSRGAFPCSFGLLGWRPLLWIVSLTAVAAGFAAGVSHWELRLASQIESRVRGFLKTVLFNLSQLSF